MFNIIRPILSDPYVVLMCCMIAWIRGFFLIVEGSRGSQLSGFERIL